MRMQTGGISSAVPAPSNNELPRMSTPRPGAAALTRAPTPYTARPTVKHRLRPYLSVILPPGIIRAAITSRKMVIAICTPARSCPGPCRCRIITFISEPAKLQMNWAKASGISALRSAFDRPPVVC